MELNFTNSQMGKSESALTPEGVKVTFVYRTKSAVIVYYGQKLIAECRNRQEALETVFAYMRKGD